MKCFSISFQKQCDYWEFNIRELNLREQSRRVCVFVWLSSAYVKKILVKTPIKLRLFFVLFGLLWLKRRNISIPFLPAETCLLFRLFHHQRIPSMIYTFVFLQLFFHSKEFWYIFFRISLNFTHPDLNLYATCFKILLCETITAFFSPSISSCNVFFPFFLLSQIPHQKFLPKIFFLLDWIL